MHTDARTQDKAVANHPALTNRGFQQVQGKVHQHKDPADEMLLKVTDASPPSPSPSFSESAPWRQPEKSSDHTRDA